MRLKRFLPVLVGALAVIGLTPAVANAAVTATMAAATTDSPDHTNFTWSCDVNPDGGTVFVMGRSWDDPGGANTTDTARQSISGSTPQHVVFHRDGAANSRYGYRCLWYADATTSTVLGKIASALFVNTGVLDTAPVAALSVSPSSVREDTGVVTADASASTDPDNDIASYTFNWGDGDTTGPQSGAIATHVYADEGRYPVVVTVTDSGSRTSTDTESVTVTTSTVFGASVDTSSGETFSTALTRQTTEYNPHSLRLFHSGLPPTSCSNQNTVAANGHPGSIISWKDAPATVNAGTDDVAINGWLSCLSTTHTTYVSYYHEAEDNFLTTADKAAYRAAGAHFASLVHAHSNHVHLATVEIYSDWTWDSGSGRNYADWYWGSSSVDYFGVDMYQFGDADTNPANDQTVSQHVNGDVSAGIHSRNWIATATSLGKPIMVPEFGYNVIAGATSQVAFLNDFAQWAEDNDVLSALYFDANGTWDTRLTSSSSRSTYANIVAAGA
jgi:hypothetical protein